MIQSFKNGIKKGVEDHTADIVGWTIKGLMIVVLIVLVLAVVWFGGEVFICNTEQNLIPIAGGAIMFAGLFLITSNPILAIIVALSSGLILHFSSIKDLFC